MTRMLKKTAVLSAALSVAPFAAVSADTAGDAAIHQQCLAIAERIWPHNTGEIAQYERNRRFLELGCLNNRGRIWD